MEEKNLVQFSPENSFSRRESNMKWLILALSALSSFGNYYCIDNVGVLHDHLKDHFKGHLGSSLNESNSFEYYFGLLYSLYSFPNIILPFIGGILIAKIGNRSVYLIVGVFLLIGQFIFAYGCSQQDITLMLIGRTLFGVGGETINITQNCMIVKWFKKEELSFPFALTITISRLGSVLNDVASPQIASNGDPSSALWTGYGIVLLSFACSIALITIDKCIDDGSSDNALNEEDNVELSSIGELNYIFWLLAIICVTLYGGFIPFNNIAAGFLTGTYFKGISEKESRNSAGVYMAIPFFIGIFFVPAFGYLIDKIGKRSYLALLSAICGLLCFIMFYLFTPLVPLITLGITYSLFATVIWPSIAIVTKKELTGLAFGISTSLQNAGLALFPVIVAHMLTKSNNNYSIALIFFVAMMVISIFFSILLIVEDSRQGEILNKIKFEEDDVSSEGHQTKDNEKSASIESNSKKERESSKCSSTLPKSSDEESEPIIVKEDKEN